MNFDGHAYVESRVPAVVRIIHGPASTRTLSPKNLHHKYKPGMQGGSVDDTPKTKGRIRGTE
jgi:hypothetical protein